MELRELRVKVVIGELQDRKETRVQQEIRDLQDNPEFKDCEELQDERVRKEKQDHLESGGLRERMERLGNRVIKDFKAYRAQSVCLETKASRVNPERTEISDFRDHLDLGVMLAKMVLREFQDRRAHPETTGIVDLRERQDHADFRDCPELLEIRELLEKMAKMDNPVPLDLLVNQELGANEVSQGKGVQSELRELQDYGAKQARKETMDHRVLRVLSV